MLIHDEEEAQEVLIDKEGTARIVLDRISEADVSTILHSGDGLSIFVEVLSVDG